MSQDRAPSRARDGIPIVQEDRTFSQDAAIVFEELWRQVVGGFVVVPTVITNTSNFYTLKARLHREGARSYGDGMIWSGVASANSTGDVTACVSTAEGEALPTVKVYKDGGSTQATAGDIVANRFYLWCYVGALDGGNGGLVLK